jgi:hypothetical protein
MAGRYHNRFATLHHRGHREKTEEGIFVFEKTFLRSSSVSSVVKGSVEKL